ncbi:hypothetical protein KZ829_14650 [Actinoplanes hulinensis]|uniref:Cyclic nucleotide-binding domain-containing protein n=1 Tax=Actinoplanes hulinensis TaxID=1144547 RepID=A0ABS7B3I4_9ACTN|nr:DUF6069 family protein [Actinoplanes hulinensis]MBW6434979.1 hypothetical protein [Actinoplanes hulinensis]
MRTLALRGGARVVVVPAEWPDAFAVVTRGRVQLELRDGEPGPVLGRGAGFWLRGTGVRALRNPGRRTAIVRVVTRRSAHPVPRILDLGGCEMSSVIRTGIVATLAAVVATTLAAALARAAGVDFEIPDGGEAIPLAGFATVTGFFSIVGVAIAVALLRWSARPAERFVWTTVSLTAISLVPPLISGAGTATVVTLIGLHLLPAAVIIPSLARSLRSRSQVTAMSA